MADRPTLVATAVSEHLAKWVDDLAVLYQNHPLPEYSFIPFASERGFSASGVGCGDPSEFYNRGLLSAEGIVERTLYFHPFRAYALHSIKVAGEESAVSRARQVNEIVDLAMLLEPLYWPAIIGQETFGPEYDRLLDEHRLRMVELVRRLKPAVWENAHRTLRLDAAALDPNGELYVLLRLSLWERRKNLKGRVAGALWTRHIAEVLRRGFEEVHAVRWPEEDMAFGHWPAGARGRIFGFDRPLDDEQRSKPFIAYHFGLFTGSALCWYVEGETEYYAVSYLLREPSRWGVELHNLKGEIATDRGNTALKLEDALKKDLSLRRLSVISFDLDVKANVRAIRRQVSQNHVVGVINAHDPDFEFANFSLSELVEVAALVCESSGGDGNNIRNADWSGVKTGRRFAARYANVSGRGALKGKAWGGALARYAAQHPVNASIGEERPLMRAVAASYWSWHSNYEFQRENFSFDPVTFALRRRQ
jgi:hypothetical protein